MTFPSDHPEPSPREDLPKALQGDLKRAYREDGIQPPSRVDDAVFAAAAKHFGEAANAATSQTEAKPGVLARLGHRPFRNAGLAGALIAASVLVVVFIGSPNPRSTTPERSIAMDQAMEPEADNFAGRSAELASGAFAEEAGDGLAADENRFSGRMLLQSGRGGGGGGAIVAQKSNETKDEEHLFDMDLSDGATETEIASAPPPAQPSAPAALARRSQVLAKGDVNADGLVNIADALLLARMVEEAGGSLDDLRYDLLGNGIVSRADADAIARLVVRLAPAPDNTNTEGAS
ncbi:MAG: dockerin type I domain-containing protein [Phycisphaerales bacterium JB050]